MGPPSGTLATESCRIFQVALCRRLWPFVNNVTKDLKDKSGIVLYFSYCQQASDWVFTLVLTECILLFYEKRVGTLVYSKHQ